MYRRRQDIEAAPLKDELLLFNAESKKFFVMNTTAAFLWDKLREPAGQPALVAALCAAFSGISEQQAVADVASTISMLVDLGLVDGDEAGPAES